MRMGICIEFYTQKSHHAARRKIPPSTATISLSERGSTSYHRLGFEEHGVVCPFKISE